MRSAVCSPLSAPKAIGWFEAMLRLVLWASPTAGRARTVRAATPARIFDVIAVIRLIPRD